MAEDRDEAAEETQEGWEEAQQGELICPEDVRAKMQQHKEDWAQNSPPARVFEQGLWEGDLSDMREDSER